jgi:tetratricopeptide (TPR) repeat protein
MKNGQGEPRTRSLTQWLHFLFVLIICVVTGLAIYEFTWPVSPLYLLTLVAWGFTSNNKYPALKAAHVVLGSVSVGLGIVVCLGVLVNSYPGDDYEWLGKLELRLVQLREQLAIWKSFSNIKVFLFVIAMALLLSWVKPGLKSVTWTSKFKQYLTRAWIAMVVVTSFTFFSQFPLDVATYRIIERLRLRYDASVKDEEDSKRKYLVATAIKEHLVSLPRLPRDDRDRFSDIINKLRQDYNQRYPGPPPPPNPPPAPPPGGPSSYDPVSRPPRGGDTPANPRIDFWRDIQSKAAKDILDRALRFSSDNKEAVPVPISQPDPPHPSGKPSTDPPQKVPNNHADTSADLKPPVIPESVSQWREQVTRQEENAQAARSRAEQAIEAVKEVFCQVLEMAIPPVSDIAKGYMETLIDYCADHLVQSLATENLSRLLRLTFSPAKVSAMEKQAALQELYNSAKNHMQLSQWEKAEETLSRIRQDFPETAEARQAEELIPECQFQAAEQNIRNQDHIKAEMYFNRLLAEYPKSRRSLEARERLDELRDAISEAHKPQVVIYYSPQCPYSRQLVGETLKEKRVAGLMNRFKLDLVNVDQHRTRALQRGITSVPTIDIINSTGSTVKTIDSAPDSEEFAAQLEGVLSPKNTGRFKDILERLSLDLWRFPRLNKELDDPGFRKQSGRCSTR